MEKEYTLLKSGSHFESLQAGADAYSKPNSNARSSMVVMPESVDKEASESSSRVRRTVFSKKQLISLETRFLQQTFLSKEERKELADELLLSERQVMVWFQNRRGRLKRRGPNDKAYSQEKLSELTHNRRPYPFLYGLLSTMQYNHAHHHPYQGLIPRQDAVDSSYRGLPSHTNQAEGGGNVSNRGPPLPHPVQQTKMAPSVLPSLRTTQSQELTNLAFTSANSSVHPNTSVVPCKPGNLSPRQGTCEQGFQFHTHHRPLSGQVWPNVASKLQITGQHWPNLSSDRLSQASESKPENNNVNIHTGNYISQSSPNEKNEESQNKTMASPPIGSLEPSVLDLTLEIPDILTPNMAHASYHVNFYNSYFPQQQSLVNNQYYTNYNPALV